MEQYPPGYDGVAAISGRLAAAPALLPTLLKLMLVRFDWMAQPPLHSSAYAALLGSCLRYVLDARSNGDCSCGKARLRAINTASGALLRFRQRPSPAPARRARRKSRQQQRRAFQSLAA